MPTIEVIIRDDAGNIMNQDERKCYNLEVGSQSFHEIEGAVESFKQAVLPDVTKELLSQAQQEFIKKKGALNCNGTRKVTIQSLHGAFVFNVQRFADKMRVATPTYFDLRGEFQSGHQSEGLKEFAAYYSNRMSYEEVSRLLERITGEASMSDQTIWKMVVEKSCQVSTAVEAQLLNEQERSQPGVLAVNLQVDIYDPEVKEILLFDDAILVKGQEEIRQKESSVTQGEVREEKAVAPFVSTDVVLLQTPTHGFEYITETIDQAGEPLVSFNTVVQSRILSHYPDHSPLNIVAITDGAKTIRTRLLAIFGGVVVLILDWYHLRKKVREMMSMIAYNKEEKTLHIREILRLLWRGKVLESLEYLNTWVNVKNQKRLQDLTGYITKHQHEIIDYGARQKAGKTIGSGRGEKAVDQVIGKRQKKKGMSWSKKGSTALGILKVVELNQKWNELWFPQEKAA